MQHTSPHVCALAASQVRSSPRVVRVVNMHAGIYRLLTILPARSSLLARTTRVVHVCHACRMRVIVAAVVRVDGPPLPSEQRQPQGAASSSQWLLDLRI